MCGRYTQRHGASAIINRFSIQRILFDQAPRFNIAPSQDIAVIVMEAGQRLLKPMRWGLVPAWADDPAIGNRMINARAETLAEKPAFRNLFRKQRCIVPADGFYEWAKGQRGKAPHHIRRPDGALLPFAGLWDRWLSRQTGEVIESVTIITVEANDLLRPLHDRMPAILHPADESAWLDPAMNDTAVLAGMLRPAPPDWLTMSQVSTRVNKPDHDDAACLDAAEGLLF